VSLLDIAAALERSHNLMTAFRELHVSPLWNSLVKVMAVRFCLGERQQRVAKRSSLTGQEQSVEHVVQVAREQPLVGAGSYSVTGLAGRRAEGVPHAHCAVVPRPAETGLRTSAVVCPRLKTTTLWSYNQCCAPAYGRKEYWWQ